jgi:hypothetical protein
MVRISNLLKEIGALLNTEGDVNSFLKKKYNIEEIAFSNKETKFLLAVASGMSELKISLLDIGVGHLSRSEEVLELLLLNINLRKILSTNNVVDEEIRGYLYQIRKLKLIIDKLKKERGELIKIGKEKSKITRSKPNFERTNRKNWMKKYVGRLQEFPYDKRKIYK